MARKKMTNMVQATREIEAELDAGEIAVPAVEDPPIASQVDSA
jgi:5-methyltetrahydropteroyltriglutamate--homocysteine methyltransferase